VNQPGDEYEQEADRVAEEVMRSSSFFGGGASAGGPPNVQKKCSACASGGGLCPKCAEEEKRLQRKRLSSAITPLVRRQSKSLKEEEFLQAKGFSGRISQLTSNLSAQIQSLIGRGGQPLPESARAFFAPRFGHDFSKIRVHADTPSVIQPKLIIGHSQDEYEQEAEQATERVLRIPKPPVLSNSSHPDLQRKCAECASSNGPCPKCVEEKKTKRRLLASQSAPIFQRQATEESEEEKEIIQTKKISDNTSTIPPEIETNINALMGSGEPLPEPVRAFFEPRFGYDFSRVRVHTDARAAKSARAVRAWAFTLGHNIVFDSGQYSPETVHGKWLLAHELTHVIQQNSKSLNPYPPLYDESELSEKGKSFTLQHKPPLSLQTPIAKDHVIQRANTADQRLPANQAEALAYAAVAETEITSAKTRLTSSPDAARRNVPAFITQRGLTMQALTPRHDSPVGAPNIKFFAGQVNYSDSVTLPATTTYHITASRQKVRIRGREDADVDNLLTPGEIENRLVLAIREVAYTTAVRQGASTAFDLYRARFNSLWDTPPFAAMPTAFDPTLSSKGPRTNRARAIFDHIYSEDAALKTAYDTNAGGIRERIDAYTGPEGLNPINSPRLQALRTAFFPFSAPVPSANYVAFKTAIQAASAALDSDDRRVVESSNDWHLLINRHVTTDPQRNEIRAIIATPPPVAPPPVPTPAPVPAPVPPVPGGMSPQAFVDSVRIDGPPSPVLANNREEQVTLTPRSAMPNPAVTIDTRFTVTPADRVRGSNVSSVSPWPNAADTGVPFEPQIINTSTIAMNGHLDLLNGPAGLAPSAPIPDLPFTVVDNRQANFIAHWSAAVNFNTGAFQQWFTIGDTVQYRGGTQNFEVGAFLPAGQNNPGLTIFVRAQILRGAAVIFPPPALTPFPPDQSQIPTFAMPISAPAVVPVGGDTLTFRVELLAADQTTVLDTKDITITVMPEVTYTEAAAETAALADDTFFHDNTPTGLLGIMTTLGGVPANVAAAINAGRITLRPLTVRHDSAAYVATQHGGTPVPSLVGYFVGTSYIPVPAPPAPPLDPNSFDGVAGAAAFSLGPGDIVVNRTTDVAAGTHRSVDSIIMLTVHEAVHAMDIRPGAGTDLERYKTEFRAYWMDGRFGPPRSAICPVPPVDCKDATLDPSLTPPGPKSPRARAIFDNLYGSVTYPFVKPAYDNNTSGFREAVDNYIIPDGINLIVSIRLEALRALINAGVTPNFASFRVKVQQFMGIVGPSPTVGVLTLDERNEIINSRAWRDLINAKISNAAHRNQIKTDLGIPL